MDLTKYADRLEKYTDGLLQMYLRNNFNALVG
jgi:hypothetical protein